LAERLSLSGTPTAVLPYVLITPARNEEKHIGRLLGSMVAQTHPPLKWVIVSDASTDRTEPMVAEYQQRYAWIQLLCRRAPHERSFAAKVDCFNDGLREIQQLQFDLIANVDADISFEPDYFAFLTSRFAALPRLGVAGTPFVEDGKSYDYRFTNIEHVSGACQMFRRECFAEIGGYVPIAGGGIDWVAVTTARMKGWQTRTFTERTCVHHRAIGTGSAGRLRAAFRQGRKDYYLGGHALWEAFRSIYQMARAPYLAAGTSLLAGYLWAAISRQPRPISPELVRFHRREQLDRLRRLITPARKSEK
jgi:poly-beta-1,6-N-acetyl-D-glucosamine synthase